jgi:hypothetical protein
MELSHKTISGEVTCLQLAGNLDIAGVLAVETGCWLIAAG